MHRKSKWGNADLGLSAAMKFITTRSTRFTRTSTGTASILKAASKGGKQQHKMPLLVNQVMKHISFIRIKKSPFSQMKKKQQG
jgi:hypothetical protein